MGQRHQIYVAIKSNNKYEAVGAWHHQWKFGMGAASSLIRAIGFIQIAMKAGRNKWAEYALRDDRELDTVIKAVYGISLDGDVSMVHNETNQDYLIKNNKFKPEKGDNNDGATLIIIDNDKKEVRGCLFTPGHVEGSHAPDDIATFEAWTPKQYLSYYYNLKEMNEKDFQSQFKREIVLLGKKIKNVSTDELLKVCGRKASKKKIAPKSTKKLSAPKASAPKKKPVAKSGETPMNVKGGWFYREVMLEKKGRTYSVKSTTRKKFRKDVKATSLKGICAIIDAIISKKQLPKELLIDSSKQRNIIVKRVVKKKVVKKTKQPSKQSIIKDMIEKTVPKKATPKKKKPVTPKVKAPATKAGNLRLAEEISEEIKDMGSTSTEVGFNKKKIEDETGVVFLEDSKTHKNRIEICSETSDSIYVVAQTKKNNIWTCGCFGFRRHRNCKHLKTIVPVIEAAKKGE